MVQSIIEQGDAGAYDPSRRLLGTFHDNSLFAVVLATDKEEAISGERGESKGDKWTLSHRNLQPGEIRHIQFIIHDKESRFGAILHY